MCFCNMWTGYWDLKLHIQQEARQRSAEEWVAVFSYEDYGKKCLGWVDGMDAPYGTPIGQVEIPIPRRLTSPPQHVFLTLFRVHPVDAKDPSAWCLRGLIGCDIRGMSEYRLG